MAMERARQTSVFYAEGVLRYYVSPTILLLLFTWVVQYLAAVGRGETYNFYSFSQLLGNNTSWTLLGVICLWAYVSLRIPGPTTLGPETPFAYRPLYQDNGFLYYIATVTTFLLANVIWPGLSATIYDNYPEFLASSNLLAFMLCIYLWIKGRYFPEFKNDKMEHQPILYEFYRGLELHPRLFGVDIKQWTNCRIGCMFWQIFVLAFFITDWQRNGFNAGSFTNLVLQTVYLAKFFWWEAGYFYTLDMMLDRAGYYLCWGCLVWIQTFYTYSTYYTIRYPNNMSLSTAGLILFIGLISIFLNYKVDLEKQVFRNAPNYKCKIWGSPATYISAEYVDSKNNKRKTALLTSGFWGKGRHINYTFELLAAFSWCAATGFGVSIMPFLYFIFLFILLLHRTIRDEDKCYKKYGKHWELYCKKVPYRLIPYVW